MDIYLLISDISEKSVVFYVLQQPLELTLPEDANVYAAAYQLYLPDKQLLKSKMKEWMVEYEEKE